MRILRRTLLLLVVLGITGILNAQEKFYTKEGNLAFEASASSFEPVAAAHNDATAVLDVTTGKLAVLALIRGFRFENSLMEEHFNENYIESATFPKATFRGELIGFDNSFENENTLAVKGKLAIREKTVDVQTKATLVKEKDCIILTTVFEVKPEDFDIEIPKVVGDKIAKTIKISARFRLNKK